MADKAKLALWARLVAAPGRENDVESFLRQGLSLVQDEPETITWYAIRIDNSTFGIFDTFADEKGRQAHLEGKVAAALKANADMFSEPPSIEKVDIIAAKPVSDAGKKAA